MGGSFVDASDASDGHDLRSWCEIRRATMTTRLVAS
jgi:hypothetical protein